MEFKDKMSHVRKVLGLSRRAMGELVDVPEGKIQKIEVGTQRADHEFLTIFASKTDADLNWLLGNRICELTDQTYPSASDSNEALGALNSNVFCEVSRYISGMRSKGIASNTITQKNYAFRKDWLEKRGLSLERLRVLRIKGDGMDPIFRDGDLVLVDNGVDTVEDGAPYVLWIMDKTVVRTLRHDGPDHWIVSHANKVYPDLRVEKSTPATKFEVTGRVVASMQEW